MSVQRNTLTPAAGLPPGLGLCFAGMEEVRAKLRRAVEGLPDDAVSRRPLPGAHSVGALLLHVGETEWRWMHCVVSSRVLTDEDRRAVYLDVLVKEDGGKDFSETGLTAADCLDILDELRAYTHRVLSQFADEDLERVFPFEGRGAKYEGSLRWILHHLTDHESHHKGQILMLKRLLKQ